MKNIQFFPMYSNMRDELFEIVPSSKVIPVWYKKMSPQVRNEPFYSLNPLKPSVTNQTVKACPPFLDAMTSGYTYLLPFDVEVKFENSLGGTSRYEFRWRITMDMITTHDPVQFPELKNSEPNESLQIYKWFNPFGIKTPPGYSTFFTHPTNRYDLPFRCFSGVVETDVYNMAVEFPFIVTTTLKKNKPLIIEKGTPLIQMIPFKREQWELKKLPFDSERTNQSLNKFFSRIHKSYKTNFWQKKSYQ